MYNFYFDSGTTNTRAYLLKGEELKGAMSVQIGSRDSALHNDNSILVRELLNIYNGLLSRHGLSDGDIGAIYMSGMISCPHGLVEIEHLSTPVSGETLAAGIVAYREKDYFKRTVHIIPGIKTLAAGSKAGIDNIEEINNMRGEEIEIMGILHRQPELKSGRVIIVLPGSHTQVAFLNDGIIENISSNITGELYNAILSETILSSALIGEDTGDIHPDMVVKGYKNLHKYGFNRSLYIVRSLLLFTNATLAERRSYMEGVLNGGVMDAILARVGKQPAVLAVAGPRSQYEVFSALFGEYSGGFKVLEVMASAGRPFSVEGLISLVGLK